MVLTRAVLLQVNATIIAGLLVLVTIQAITIPSFPELIFEVNRLDSPVEIIDF